MGTRALKGLVVVACVGALAVAVAPIASSSTSTASRSGAALAALDAGLLEQLNAIRAHYDLPALRESIELDAAATEHSREMGVDGYFEHSSANGTSFSARIAHWYSSAGFSRWSVGENLLWSSPFVGASAAMDSWMHSPMHRANILDPAWREVGVAAVHFGDASGAYGGRSVTIVTTDFGVRH